ncbi:MAG: cytochrome c [Nitrospinaceae bacterium]|jgi:cytochrome c556|nr:cytochrome c [Nitrospinaceae bacterium]MBT3433056.1 cytochrome c [Nitrospinaceae bacterium]MBT3822917.1 cytochrome c [Nitrospinaceae bacterium]MBT4093184.1 cytochrome c [Nitrospinaceae bacterium]MBT4430608.1 cytochrome c [Nitrospinaceae bacterium]
MEKLRFWKKLAVVVLATGFIGGCVKLNDDLGQIFKYNNPKIEARKKVMRGIAGNMKRIKITMRAGSGIGPMRQIKWAAEDIAKLARKIPGTFKHQTLAGKTTATNKIWGNWSGFTQVATNLVTSAEVLALAADGQDMGGVKNSIKTVGANCGKCHKGYRVKKKKKRMKK